MKTDSNTYGFTELSPLARQRGAALIFSLLILLVLTILALSSMRSTTMEELLARNTRDYKIAFESSSSGISDAIGTVADPSYTAPPSGCTGAADPNVLCTASLDHDAMNAIENITAKDNTWWATYGKPPAGITAADLDPGTISSGSSSSATMQLPLVITDHMLIRDSLVSGFEAPQGKHVYRVSTRGTGLSSNTQVVVQQTYFKPY